MSKLSGREIADTHQKYILQSWSKSGATVLPVDHAEGIFYYDCDGKKYADMSSLMVNANLGHGNKRIVNAIKEQADRLCYMAPAYATEPKSTLAKMLVQLAGEDKYSRVFFTCDGADANENAIKMARIFTGRTKVFSGYRSYHGATLGASNASGDWRRFAAELGGANGFVKFMNPHMYQDGYTRGKDDAAATGRYLSELERQMIFEGTDNIAALIVESIVGANGVLVPPDGYMQGLRALCDKYGILMICDEVMAGFCRTGKLFAFQNFDIRPDLISFAKGVTCGYVPLGGVIVGKAIAEYFENNVLQCGLTYSGHTLACAAGVAALSEYIDRDICAHVMSVEPVIASWLNDIKDKHPCVGDVRGKGVFWAVELVKDKNTREPLVHYSEISSIMPAIFAELKKRGFSSFGRENNIEICPPCIITEAEINEYMPILDEVLSWVDTTYLS